MKTVEVAEFDTAIYDHTVKSDNTILDLQHINLEMANVDGHSPMDVFLEFEEGQGGSIGMSGVVNPSVPSLHTEVIVTEIALAALQPYIDPYVGIALRSGVFSTRGRLVYGEPASNADLSLRPQFATRIHDLDGL